MILWSGAAVHVGGLPSMQDLGGGVLYTLILVAAGSLVSLVVTIPCGFLWVATARRLLPRGPRARPADTMPDVPRERHQLET